MKEKNRITPKISVIIPCYNVQDTIINTLESLENQTCQDFEVIIVDDGSVDKSQVIIKEFIPNTFLNIYLFSQKNAGVSAARNLALKNVKGKYITFLDADDEYAPRFLEVLLEVVKNDKYDIALCRYAFEREECTTKSVENGKLPQRVAEKIELLQIYMHKRVEKVSFCGGIYRTEILKKYQLCFETGVKYGEDTSFYCKYLYHCDKGGVYISHPLYVYTQRQESATHNTIYEMTQNIEEYKKIANYWKSDKNYIKGEMGTYMISRAIWGVAKKFALSNSKNLLLNFQNEYDVDSAMKYMVRHGDELTIRLSASAYCISPILFTIIVKLQNKISNILV